MNKPSVGFLEWCGSLATSFYDPFIGYKTTISSDIKINANYRTALLGMQQQPEIRQFLLDFCSKRFSFSFSHSAKKDSYMAMRLGLKILSTVLECHSQGDDISVFFQSYQEALALYCDNSNFIDKKTLFAESKLAVRNILQTLEKDTSVAFSTKQKTCEEKTFLAFYEINKNKLMTKEKRSELSSFFQNKESYDFDGVALSSKVDSAFQLKFLKFCFKKLSKESVYVFENACQQTFSYYPAALKDAKHQALFEALKKGPRELKACINRCREELTLKADDINRYFQVSHIEGSEELSGEPLAHITSDSETLLTWAIKHSYSTQRESIIQLLCEEGANINQANNTSEKKDALHNAITHDCWALISFFVQKGANCFTQDFKGRTPLSALVDRIDEHFRGKSEDKTKFSETNVRFLKGIYVSIETLVSKKTVNQKDEIQKYKVKQPGAYIAIEGATPFLKFMIYSFKLFLKTDGDVASSYKGLSTPFGTAPSFMQFFDLFVNKGADFKASDIRYNTLLHYLANENISYDRKPLDVQTAIVWAVFLSDYPVSWRAKNSAGASPGAFARANGRSKLEEAMQILSEKGGKPCIFQRHNQPRR